MRTLGERGVYAKSMFQYDHDLDVYKCPEGNILTRFCNSGDKFIYRGSAKICKNCTVVDKCTKAKGKVRTIERGNYELEWELHEEYIKSDRYQ